MKTTKRFLTLLALTLFGAGAWAQSIHVTFFDVPDSWNGDNTYITAADLEGFQSITADEAQAGASIQSEGVVYLFYAINGQNVSMMAFAAGMYGGGTTEPVTRNAFYVAQNDGAEIYYSSAIELTPGSNNTVWTLGQTPDYDIELQVEYAQPYALKNIPEGWTVTADGQPVTILEGDSALITETAQVVLTPDNPRRVKSVTLVDDAPAVQTITVAGLQLNYVEGENWVQTAQRNPGVIEIDGSYVNKTTGYFLKAGSSVVSPTSTYDSSLNYWWEEW